MFDHLVETNDEVKKSLDEYNIKDPDLVFIKDLIKPCNAVSGK